MKIQFLINSLISGGAERIAATIFNELSKNHEIYFYTLEKDKFYELKKEINYKILSNITFETNIGKKLSHLPISLLKYIKETKRNDPDVLISFLEQANYINIITAKILKKRVIVSVHTNPETMYDHKTTYGRANRHLIKKLYPKADLIVSVSKEIAEILKTEFSIPKKKIKTIYNPHYIEKYIKQSKEQIDEEYKKIFKNSFVFISIGRLTEAKGQWFLIRAFKKVVKKYKKAKLIILGQGELKEKLQKLINKLGLEKNVFLLGLKKNPFKFLKHSQCFVFPSLWEGLPNTIIEALSINLPIISTDCKTGPREILCPELDIKEKIKYPYSGKYGILTKPFPRKFIWTDDKLINEENMLADKMVEIIENEKLRKKYSNGLKRARDFDANKIIKEWEKVLSKQ